MCFLLCLLFFKENLYTEVEVGGWCSVPVPSLFTFHPSITGASVSPWTSFWEPYLLVGHNSPARGHQAADDAQAADCVRVVKGCWRVGLVGRRYSGINTGKSSYLMKKNRINFTFSVGCWEGIYDTDSWYKLCQASLYQPDPAFLPHTTESSLAAYDPSSGPQQSLVECVINNIPIPKRLRNLLLWSSYAKGPLFHFI